MRAALRRPRRARRARRMDDERVLAGRLGLVHRLVGLAQQVGGVDRRGGRSATVMPIEAVTTVRRPSSRKLPCARTASDELVRDHVARLVSRCPGRISANSSPPMRARMSVSRSTSRNASLMRTSRASPAAWPKASLTPLKPSRSSSSSAAGRRWRRARLTSRASSSSKRRRLKSPVSASRSARCWSWASKVLRSEMSTRLDEDQALAVGAEREARHGERPDLVAVAVHEAQLGRAGAARDHARRSSPAQRQVIRMHASPAGVARADPRASRPSMLREREVALHDLGACRPRGRGSRACRRAPTRTSVSKRPRAAASSRALRSRSVTSSDTPPSPMIDARGVAHGELVRPDVAQLARARVRDELVEALRHAALDDLAVVGGELLVDLGRERLGHRPAEQLVGRRAHDRAGLGVGDDPALLEVAHVDRHRAVVEDRLQTRLGLGQLHLGDRLRGDVARGHRRRDHAPSRADRAEGRLVDRRRGPRSAGGSSSSCRRAPAVTRGPSAVPDRRAAWSRARACRSSARARSRAAGARSRAARGCARRGRRRSRTRRESRPARSAALRRRRG